MQLRSQFYKTVNPKMVSNVDETAKNTTAYHEL